MECSDSSLVLNEAAIEENDEGKDRLYTEDGSFAWAA